MSGKAAGLGRWLAAGLGFAATAWGAWAEEGNAKNPGHGMALPDSAAHSRPLNGALKGRAFWWMLARLAGWSGA